ncbi:hypothetical protein AX16_008949 [Volvariella volvacea WC 439]|nr:hypothetical protein AX16_008949 [Volvariella volvacea WC 439]
MAFGIRTDLDPVDPPKTYDDVVADLLTQLCQGANASLGSNAIILDDPPTIDNLKDIFTLLAAQRFKQNFGYDYAGRDSKPPNSVFTALSASAVFFDAQDGESASSYVPGLVSKDIMGSLSVPSWCKDAVQKALTTECSTILESSGLINNWTSDKFIGTYPAVGKYDNAFHADAMFVYIHGSLTEDTISVTRTALFYIGVYYEVEAVAKKEKEALWNTVCNSANTLIPEPLALSTPPILGELTTILEQYRDKTFAKDFSFSYGGLNSTPASSVGDTGRVSYLFVFQDDDTSSLQDNLDNRVIAKLNLPTWLQDTARADILQELKYCLSAPSDPNNWTPVKIDMSYFPASPTDQTILDKAEILYRNAVSANVHGVSSRYIYYSAVFYKVPSVHDVVYGDLIKTLCNSGQSMLSEPLTVSNPPTKEDLDKIAIAISNAQFRKTFGLEYKGTSTQPEDKSSASSAVYACQACIYPELDDTTAVANFVDQQILPGLALPFASQETSLLDSIRRDLIKQVQEALQASSGTSFRNLSQDKSYSYSDDSHAPLETKGLFLFVNATATEASQNNYTARVSFVYYTGICYDQEADEW